MSYNKTKWINDQTKLSATNFNHMENGIEEAHILVEEVGLQAQRALQTALEAKDEAEHIDLSSKQDVLESGVNIKTINGKSILGEGDLPIEEGEQVNYQELIGASLDELVETGIYSIIDARDIPEGTSDEGTLKVQKLSDEKVEQEWKSTTNTAQRILVDGSSAGNKFYVNGVERPQGEITLTAGNTYELQGNLQGNIIIEGTANNRTKLILKGVNIQSSLVDSIINYTPDSSKLVIEIANGTENYLVVDKDEPTGDNDVGVINSNNNLMITGVGYLSIVNGKGHGIKASELVIDGEPHIYLDTNHDAVHGGKLLKISGGYFVVNNANDAFSASDGGSNTGKLLIYGGTYDIRACKEAGFEGKSANGIKRVLNANITFGEGVNKLFNASDASSPAYQVKVYQGLNTITNNSGKEYSEVDMADDFVGEPTIVFGGEVDIKPVSGVFTLTQPGTYTLNGNFSNYKIISNPPAGDNKMNFNLDNVYYNNDDELDPFINHLSADKRLKFDTASKDFLGKLCYIKKAKGNIIQSASSIQFDGKADVFIRGGSGVGISAPNGYVLLANDTIRSISGCLHGIEADNVRLGKDWEDVIEDHKYTTSDTAIYLMGNDVDIQTNYQTGSYDLYYDHASIVAPQYHTGIAIIGSITPNSAKVEACYDTIEGAGYMNKAIVYVDRGPASQINVNQYTALDGVKEEIPSIEPGQTSPWNVYKGDGYSKSEADEQFVSKSVYDALLAELNERAPKTVKIINYVEDPTKEDHRPAADHAYCPVEIEGETVRIVDAVEIFRYACPERIDIDDAPETHGGYVKDGRPMYARDGDFGYPEIDRTGQFNFRPVWNMQGYVIIPEGITPADGYNNFKTQWNTGIPGLYRFTKINSDLTLDLHAAKEADMPAHVITYKIVAPLDYPTENLPQVRIFRGADHCEKFMKYGPGAATPVAHPELDEGLISGNLLVLGEPTTEEIDGEQYHVWTVLDKAYDDGHGLPSADTGDKTNAKVYFNVSGTLAEGYACEVSAKKVNNNYNKMNNPTAAKKYYTLTKVQGNVEVTVKVVVDLPDVTLTFVNNSGYTIENTAEGGAAIVAPLTINALKDFQFKIAHNLGDEDKTHPSAITSVLINGVESTILKTDDLESADAAVAWKAAKKQDECRIKKAYIPSDAEGTIVITVDTTYIPEPAGE